MLCLYKHSVDLDKNDSKLIKIIAFSKSLWLSVVSIANANSKKVCPGLEESTGAEEQVLRWFERSPQKQGDCIRTDGSIDECVRQTVALCGVAPLDNRQVSNSCFL